MTKKGPEIPPPSLKGLKFFFFFFFFFFLWSLFSASLALVLTPALTAHCAGLRGATPPNQEAHLLSMARQSGCALKIASTLEASVVHEWAPTGRLEPKWLRTLAT
uniref:Uncharacterized protein n=1 Tax=Prorocentrum micans TaxID=2945 RepID=A0A7S2TCK7_PROMC